MSQLDHASELIKEQLSIATKMCVAQRLIAAIVSSWSAEARRNNVFYATLKLLAEAE